MFFFNNKQKVKYMFKFILRRLNIIVSIFIEKVISLFFLYNNNNKITLIIHVKTNMRYLKNLILLPFSLNFVKKHMERSYNKRVLQDEKCPSC